MSPDGEFGSTKFPEMDKKLEVKAETKPSVSPKSESMGLEGIIVNMPQVTGVRTTSISSLLFLISLTHFVYYLILVTSVRTYVVQTCNYCINTCSYLIANKQY